MTNTIPSTWMQLLTRSTVRQPLRKESVPLPRAWYRLQCDHLAVPSYASWNRLSRAMANNLVMSLMDSSRVGGSTPAAAVASPVLFTSSSLAESEPVGPLECPLSLLVIDAFSLASSNT